MSGGAFNRDERAAFGETVARIALDHARQGAMAAWSKLAETGCLALPFPARLDGLGGGMEEICILMEAAGRDLLTEPYAESVVGAGHVLAEADATGAAELLSAIAAGAAIVVGPTFPHDVGLEAQVDGGALSLSGTFGPVPFADVAGVLLFASDDKLFRLDTAQDGLTLAPTTLIDGTPAAVLECDGCTATYIADVPDRLLRVNHHRLAVATSAEGLGAISALNAMTLDYAKVRRQFGVAIGSFQVIQHRLVDMKIEEERARAIVYAAARAMDREMPEAGSLASIAKATMNGAARHVAEMAIQIHGGMGLASETGVGRYLKRLMKLRSSYGDDTAHLDFISCEVRDCA